MTANYQNGKWLEQENDNEYSLRCQTITFSYGLIRLSRKRLLELSHCDCCVETRTFVTDKMTEVCSDSPAAWSGLSAVCCRGCI